MKKSYSILTVCILFQLNILAQKEFLDRKFFQYSFNDKLTDFVDNDLDSLALDSMIISYMNLHSIPGLATMIIEDDHIIWNKNYGNRNLALQLPVEDSTLFLIASVSKLIVATAVMQLWENGVINLESDINNYLPTGFFVHNPYYQNDSITVKMLMTHTSSIQDNWNILDPLTTCGDSPIPLDSFLTNYLSPGGKYFNPNNFYNYHPGQQYNYTNAGVSLLALIVENLTGKYFAEYCHDSIFIPLSMNNTSWFLTGMNLNNIATPYWGSIAMCHQGWVIYPSAFLRTNKLELCNFLYAYINNGVYNNYRLLDSATISYMLSDHLGYVANSRVQGLIWHKHNAFNGKLWGHFGWWEGVETYAGFNPNEGYGIIWFQNSGDPYSNFMSAEILPAFADYAYSITTSVEESYLQPSTYRLEQNYPNPFNPSTTIKYSNPVSEFVTLKIYDVLGNEVATLVDEYKPAGSYEVEFNASSLPSGTYFYQLMAGSFVETRKMVVIK